MIKEFEIAILYCNSCEAECCRNIYQIDTERSLTPELEVMLAKMFVTM